MEFDQVIAPFGRDAFLTDHWEKSWLHLGSQSVQDYFTVMEECATASKLRNGAK